MGRVVRPRVALLVVVLTSFGGGWAGGASGSWEANRALRAAHIQYDILEARTSLLHARLSLYEGDLVDVTRQLEYARTCIERAASRPGPAGMPDTARSVDLQAASAQIDDANRLVAALTTQPGAIASR